MPPFERFSCQSALLNFVRVTGSAIDPNTDNNADVWVLNVRNNSFTQLTDLKLEDYKNAVHDANPMLGADGMIYFSSERDGIFNIWKISPRGGNATVVFSAAFCPIGFIIVASYCGRAAPSARVPTVEGRCHARRRRERRLHVLRVLLAAALLVASVAPARAQQPSLIRDAEIEHISRVLATPIFAAAGLKKPDISILSDEFLDSLVDKERPNLQIGLLRRLINDQIRTIRRTDVVQSRRFSELLDEAINRYTNRSLTTAEIIAELVKLAKDMRENSKRHEELGLTESEAGRLSDDAIGRALDRLFDRGFSRDLGYVVSRLHAPNSSIERHFTPRRR